MPLSANGVVIWCVSARASLVGICRGQAGVLITRQMLPLYGGHAVHTESELLKPPILGKGRGSFPCPSGVKGEWKENWPVVCVSGLALGMHAGATYTLGTFIVPLNKALGWSATEVVLVQTVLATIIAILLPAVGLLLDRFGDRLLAIPGILIVSASLAGLALMPGTLVVYYTLWATLAVGLALMSPMVLLKPIFECFLQTPALACSIALLGTNIAASVAPLLCAYLIHSMGWRAGFAGLAIYMFASGLPLLIWLLLRPRVRHNETEGKPKEPSATPGLMPAEAIQTRAFWMMILSFFLAGGSGVAVVVYLPPLLVENGVAPIAAAGAVSIVGVAGLGGRILAGVLMDRCFVPRLAALFLLLPVPALLAADSVSVPYSIVVIAAILIGLSAGAEFNMIPYLSARYFGKRALGMIGSLMYSVFVAGGVVIPLAVSLLHDRFGSYKAGVSLLCAFFIIAATAMLLCPRYPKELENHDVVSQRV